jgi:putative heme iron utilization protein
MNLSENVTLQEFEASPTATARGIANKMNATQIESAKLLCEKVFQPLRAHVGQPIKINSGFRSAALNKAIGGSTTSQHCKGEAMDLDLHDKALFIWIIDNLDFDQAIFEGGTENAASWFHISYKKSGNRKQALRMTNGKYSPFKR